MVIKVIYIKCIIKSKEHIKYKMIHENFYFSCKKLPNIQTNLIIQFIFRILICSEIRRLLPRQELSANFRRFNEETRSSSTWRPYRGARF